MLYIVSWSSYEDYRPYLVEGPEQEDWEAFCRGLLPEAIEEALTNPEYPDNWLGWNAIVAAMVRLLERRGYTRLRPEQADFCGTHIIDDSDDACLNPDETTPLCWQKVFDHNLAVRLELDSFMRKHTE